MPFFLSGRTGITRPEIVLGDSFNRVNSATTMDSAETGQTYSVATGTWGISSNQAYSASDTNNNTVSAESDLANGWARSTINGTISSAVTVRIPWLVFRYLDVNTFLEAGLNNGSVLLRKNASGFTSLTTAATTTSDGTDYILDVFYLGDRVVIRVDDLALIDYTLTGGDTAYSAYTSVGMHMTKAGAPATAARWDNLIIRRYPS